MAKSEQEILDEMLAAAGLDITADTTLEGDLQEHIWTSKLEGGAIYSDDANEFVCQRCSRELTVLCKTEDPPEFAQTDAGYEAEEAWHKAHENDQPEHETINQAMDRMKIDRACCNEVMKDVMTR